MRLLHDPLYRTKYAIQPVTKRVYLIKIEPARLLWIFLICFRLLKAHTDKIYYF